jgi:hypothetical protein
MSNRASREIGRPFWQKDRRELRLNVLRATCWTPTNARLRITHRLMNYQET